MAEFAKHLQSWRNLQETQIANFEHLFGGLCTQVDGLTTVPHRLAQIEAQSGEMAKLADSLDVLEKQLHLRMGDVETMVARRFENFSETLSQVAGGDEGGEPTSGVMMLKMAEMEQRLLTQERNQQAAQRDLMNNMREAAKEEAILLFKREQTRARKAAALAAAADADAAAAPSSAPSQPDSEPEDEEEPVPIVHPPSGGAGPQPAASREVVADSNEENVLIASEAVVGGSAAILSRRTSVGGTVYHTRSVTPESAANSPAGTRPVTADQHGGEGLDGADGVDENGEPLVRGGRRRDSRSMELEPKVRMADAYGDPQYATQIRTLRRSFVKTQDELRKNNEMLKAEHQEVSASQSQLRDIDARVQKLESAMGAEQKVLELENVTCELAAENRELKRSLEEMRSVIAEMQRPKQLPEDADFRLALEEVTALADGIRNSDKRLAPGGVVLQVLEHADNLLITAANEVESAKGCESNAVLKLMQVLLRELRSAARPGQMLNRKDKEVLAWAQDRIKRAIKALMDALRWKISTTSLDLRLRDVSEALEEKTDLMAVTDAIRKWSQGEEMQARFNAFSQQLAQVGQDLDLVRNMINTVEQGAADPRTVKIIAKNLETANSHIATMQSEITAKADRQHMNLNLQLIQEQLVNLQRIMPQFGDLVERLDNKADAQQLRRLQRVVEYTHLSAEEFAPMGATRCISCNRPASVGGAGSSPPGSLRAHQLFGPQTHSPPPELATLSQMSDLSTGSVSSPARGGTLVDALSVASASGKQVQQTTGKALTPSDITFSPFPKLASDQRPGTVHGTGTRGSPVKAPRREGQRL